VIAADSNETVNPGILDVVCDSGMLVRMFVDFHNLLLRFLHTAREK
jgi:hypothetical protein